MKRYLLLLGFVLVCSRPAVATEYYVNFCPGADSCPGGVTEASLNFTEDLLTADTNDYLLDIVITGNSSSPYYVDELSFATLADNDSTGYGSVDLLAAPTDGDPWQVFFSNISANSDSCTSSDGNSKEVCIQSDPLGGSFGAPLQGNTLEWQLYVDLAAGYVLDAGSPVNLRAQFLNQNGSKAGILSPGGGSLRVPEPSTVMLLALGLALVFVTPGRLRTLSDSERP